MSLMLVMEISDPVISPAAAYYLVPQSKYMTKKVNKHLLVICTSDIMTP